MEFRFIYITTKDKAEAQLIGRRLVELRLAACANIFEQMESIYWWADEVQESAEAVLILKTRADLVPALTEEVKRLHSYSCPCVVAMPIVGGNPSYLSWLASETREPSRAAQ